MCSESHTQPGRGLGMHGARSRIERLGSRTLDMDLLQFLAFVFVMLLSGTGVTGTLRTSLDPSLEIYTCCSGMGPLDWDHWIVQASPLT
ncbi:coiled-coil domain-containing protein 134 [Prionailurus iriomotensis]